MVGGVRPLGEKECISSERLLRVRSEVGAAMSG